MKKTGWVNVRAAANEAITNLFLKAARGRGGNCIEKREKTWLCTGVDGIDDLNDGGITFGNVYLLGDEYKPSKTGDKSLKHERKHSDQWAWWGLTTFVYGLPETALVGQLGFLATYLASEGISQLSGMGSCLNVYEILAGRDDGGYRC